MTNDQAKELLKDTEILVDLLAEMHDALLEMADEMEGMGKGKGKADSMPKPDSLPGMSYLDQAAKELGDTFGQLKGAMGSLLAIPQAITSGLSSITGAVAPFVAALNPSLMQNFQLAFRDLLATIGVAFQPVVQVMASLTRQIGGILLPVMQALAPTVGNIAQAFANTLAPMIGVLAEVLKGIAPVLEFLSGIFRALSEAIQVYYIVVKSVVQSIFQVLQGLFSGTDLKDALTSFRNVLHEVIKALVQVVAFVARSFGATGFIDNLVNSLHEAAKPEAGIKAAPTNVGVSSFESITKELSVAAFSAQGAGPEAKSERDFLEELARSVQEIKDGKTFEQFVNQLIEKLPDSIKDGVRRWWDEIKGFLGQGAQEIIQGAKESAAGVVASAGAGVQAAPSILGAGLALPASLLGF